MFNPETLHTSVSVQGKLTGATTNFDCEHPVNNIPIKTTKKNRVLLILIIVIFLIIYFNYRN